LPNVNIVEEMVNMVNASKAYEANAAVAETSKSMLSSSMKI
jgi:flagellar basal-body rod protein FlgC